MTDAVVELGDRSGAAELAALHLRAAIAGYGHIFPPEAPPPTLDELTAMWEHWLGDDWDRGRRAFVARLAGDSIGVVLTGARKPTYEPAGIDDVQYRLELRVSPSG